MPREDERNREKSKQASMVTMRENTRSFIVTEFPPWYASGTHRNAFLCKSSRGLLDEVASIMSCKQKELSAQEKKFKPKTIINLVKDKVILDSHRIPQKPSKSLVCAVLDLLDIRTKGIESSTVDKAGIKNVLLAYGNYKCLYVPPEKMSSPDGRKVISVITQYCEEQNFAYHDRSRSMLGTYIAVIPYARRDSTPTYFIQEVLFVPGLESLELLRRTAGEFFVFWDMSLEVPTHPEGLTPSFQQIQPLQLLRTEQMSATQLQDCKSDKKEDLESGHNRAEVAPMCCVLDKAAAVELRKKREASIDCFTEEQIVCSLKHFLYEHNKTRVVYFRRSGRLIDGLRVHLLPVVAVKECQEHFPQLYVSTTVRFLRALKQCSMKGSGELVSCWDETLREFNRKTFVTGPDTIHQDIHFSALTAFMKRVSPNSWCHKIPRHVESMIENPITVEIVELGITFMEYKIPNPFGVAELLACPIERVREYVEFWNSCSSDSCLRAAVTKTRVDMIKKQMRADWSALSDIASQYGRKRYKSDATRRSVFEDLLKNHTVDDIAKIQKTWHALVRCDLVKSKDKDLVQLHAKVKVLFLKLRTFHNKVKKELKAAEGERCQTKSPALSQAKDGAKEPCEAHKSDKPPTTSTTSTTQKVFREELYSIIITDPVPIATWIKNMSSLLLCNPWLTNEPIRRDAVCTLLGLDATLLSKQGRETLCEWVIYNRATVDILRAHNPKDRLSKALVGCLDSTLVNTGINKTVSFRVPMEDVLSAEQHSVKRSSCPDTASANNKSSKRRRVRPQIKSLGTSAGAGKLRGLDSRANKRLLSEHSKAYRMSRAPLMMSEWFDNEALDENSADESREEGTSEEEEEEDGDDDYADDIWGEDLEVKSSDDENDTLDEYDTQDPLINDGDISVHEDSGNEDVCLPWRLRSKRIQHEMMSNTVLRRNVKRVKRLPHVDSDGEDEVSVTMNQDDTATYNRKFESTDEEEHRYTYESADQDEEQVLKPVVKRVKYSGLSSSPESTDDTGSARSEKKRKKKERKMRKERLKATLPATSKNKKKNSSSSQAKPQSARHAEKQRTCKYPLPSSPLCSDKESAGYETEEGVLLNEKEICTAVSSPDKRGKAPAVSSPDKILPHDPCSPRASPAPRSPTPPLHRPGIADQENMEYFVCM